MSEQRTRRRFSAEQKLEIVLAGLRGDRSVREVCREHEIAEALYYNWRDKLLEGGGAALSRAGDSSNVTERELRKKVAQLERALGRKSYELEVAGELSRGWE